MGIRTGVIGCGIAAKNYHLPILRRLPEAELVAVADTFPDAMEDIQDVEKFEYFQEMIDDMELDSIHLTTPPSFRLPVIQEAAEAGISILIEKPTSFNTAEINEIIKIRDNSGISICCTQNMRFLPITQLGLEMVSDGDIGDVTAIDNVFSIPKDLSGSEQGQPWVKDIPGGAIGEGAPHLVYIPLAFAGELSGDIDISVRKYKSIDFFDGISIATRDESHRLITARYLTKSYPMRRLTIHGTDGYIIVDYINNKIFIKDEGFRMVFPEGFTDRWLRRIKTRLPGINSPNFGFVGYSRGHLNLVVEYLEAIESGGSVPVPLEDDKDVVKILELL